MLQIETTTLEYILSDAIRDMKNKVAEQKEMRILFKKNSFLCFKT